MIPCRLWTVRLISHYEHQENWEGKDLFTSGSTHLQILSFILHSFGFYLFQASKLLSWVGLQKIFKTS